MNSDRSSCAVLARARRRKVARRSSMSAVSVVVAPSFLAASRKRDVEPASVVFRAAATRMRRHFLAIVFGGSGRYETSAQSVAAGAPEEERRFNAASAECCWMAACTERTGIGLCAGSLVSPQAARSNAIAAAARFIYPEE